MALGKFLPMLESRKVSDAAKRAKEVFKKDLWLPQLNLEAKLAQELLIQTRQVKHLDQKFRHRSVTISVAQAIVKSILGASAQPCAHLTTAVQEHNRAKSSIPKMADKRVLLTQ
jgi:hypothetical protein